MSKSGKSAEVAEEDDEIEISIEVKLILSSCRSCWFYLT